MKTLWRILKRCKHCFSKNVEQWDDSKLAVFNYGWYGWHCKDCDMITIIGKKS